MTHALNDDDDILSSIGKERLHCRDAHSAKPLVTNGQSIGTSCNADFNSTDHNHTIP